MGAGQGAYSFELQLDKKVMVRRYNSTVHREAGTKTCSSCLSRTKNRTPLTSTAKAT